MLFVWLLELPCACFIFQQLILSILLSFAGIWLVRQVILSFFHHHSIRLLFCVSPSFVNSYTKDLTVNVEMKKAKTQEKERIKNQYEMKPWMDFMFKFYLLCPSTFNIGPKLDGERGWLGLLFAIIVAVVVVAIDKVECLLDNGEPWVGLVFVSIYFIRYILIMINVNHLTFFWYFENHHIIIYSTYSWIRFAICWTDKRFKWRNIALCWWWKHFRCIYTNQHMKW